MVVDRASGSLLYYLAPAAWSLCQWVSRMARTEWVSWPIAMSSAWMSAPVESIPALTSTTPFAILTAYEHVRYDGRRTHQIESVTLSTCREHADCLLPSKS